MLFDFPPSDRERVAFRHAVHVDCQVVRERDFKLIGRRTLDLSTTGMLVQADEDVAIGESLIVSFRAPRTDRYVDAEAIVTRVVHGRRRGDLGPALAVTFTQIDRASFTTLKTALRRMPGTRAQRRSRIDYASMVRIAAML